MFQNELNPYMKYHPSVVIHLLVSWQAFVGPQLDSLSAVVWRSFWAEITRPFRWPLSSPKMLRGTVALSLSLPRPEWACFYSALSRIPLAADKLKSRLRCLRAPAWCLYVAIDDKVRVISRRPLLGDHGWFMVPHPRCPQFRAACWAWPFIFDKISTWSHPQTSAWPRDPGHGHRCIRGVGTEKLESAVRKGQLLL